ncbi:MAG: oligoendopeptidase pepF/M3 family [Planctomycetaceae bacterium]|nr:oligoendopeptidase pepF/M3 family [Planctomycetaceae bacterium]
MTNPSSAQGVYWDLNDLYLGLDDPRIEADLKSCLTASQSFAAQYRGFFKTSPTPAAVGAAFRTLEAIYLSLSKLGAYAGLRTAVDNLNVGCRQLEDRIDQASVEIQNLLTFFELEWLQVSEEDAQKLADAPELENYQHYLLSGRRYKPHTLSEQEEVLLNHKSLTARSAWVNLFDEFLASMEYRFDYNGEQQTLTQPALLALSYQPDRGMRKAAQECLYTELSRHELVLTNVFNAITQDHGLNDQIRHYQSPIASRHLANEIETEVVDRMQWVTESNYDIAHRYYRLKARLLGLEKMATYDQYAPVATKLPSCGYEDGRQMVLTAFGRFDPNMQQIASQFFEKNWIDAEVRPGKRGGAFSASTVPTVHPYVMLNWTDKLRDVNTMAHELGHGVHQYLSRQQTYFNFHHPLPVAETASVFGEFLTFDYLMEIETDPEVKLGLLCSKIEDAFATVFRQNVLTRFEQLAHKARREQKLSSDQICDHWWQANQALYGDSVDMLEQYRWGWSYIPHFIHTPFYCYAYVFGELLVLSLYRMYQEEGRAFVPRYLELLKSGSKWEPAELLNRVGADIRDGEFWQKGFEVLRSLVGQAEDLAKKLGR